MSEYTRVSGAWLVKTLTFTSTFTLHFKPTFKFDTVVLFHIGNPSAAVARLPECVKALGFLHWSKRWKKMITTIYSHTWQFN